MSVKILCPKCSKELFFPEAVLGKRGQCSGCKEVFAVPAAVGETAVPSWLPNLEPAPQAPPAPGPAAAAPQPAASNVAAMEKSFRQDLLGGADRMSARRMQAGLQPRSEGFFAPEKKGISMGMVGGILMMAIAVIWFVVGYSLGWVFFYPPILFIIGLFAFFKGMATGNIAGRR